jgi:O-antigen biosynthesis protein
MKVCVLTTVWPEPDSSAVGVRLLQWIEFFERWGAEVTVASPGRPLSKEKRPLPPGVRSQQLALNRSDQDHWWQEEAFDLVLFERFTTEEQFGFQVERASPKTLRILETVDIHFLRKQRERGIAVEQDELRERSAAARCDLTFVCSFAEVDILTQPGASPVEVVPFLYSEVLLPIVRDEKPSTANTCLFIGNFRHGPNREGIAWFVQEVWPKVRAALPEARLLIAGAYPTPAVHALEKAQTGVSVLGSIPDLDAFFSRGVLNLAPLHFGAGIKGKILEGWRRGVPCVATTIGAEGFSEDGSFGGVIADDVEGFAAATIQLITDPKLRAGFVADGERLLREVHSMHAQEERVRGLIADALRHRDERRAQNWVGRALSMSLNRSTEYFSRWIELKEKLEAMEQTRNRSHKE